MTQPLKLSGGRMIPGMILFLAMVIARPSWAAAEQPSLPAPPDASIFAVKVENFKHPDRGFFNHPSLNYRPLTPTASLMDLRIRWQDMRMMRFSSDGWANMGGSWLKATEQGTIYRNAGAGEALALYRKGQKTRTEGIFWIVLAPEAGMMVGEAIGNLVPATKLNITFGDDYKWLNNFSGGIPLATIGGFFIGLGVGYFEAVSKRTETQDLRVRAGESFNKKLWQDLKLEAQSIQGGGKVGVKGKF